MIIQKKLVLAILCKLIILSIFTSQYNSDLFFPFVGLFVNNLENPWHTVFTNSLTYEFPYHGLMLYVLSVFSFLISLLNIENYYISNFIFKLPLFIADILIYVVLIKLFPFRQNKVIIFYFLNPIILYAIYIHSQLDIIPTALLLISLYLLILKKVNLSSLLFGLSMATKIHTIIALPLILIYLLKVYGIKNVIKFIFISLGTLVVIDFPFILQDGFIQMVILNDKQILVFDSFYNIGGVKILLPIASLLSIYFVFLNTKKINDDILFVYVGMVFAVLIFFILPSPAWYVWLMPFISIFFIKNSNFYKTLSFYSLLSVAYLSFYLFFYQDEYQNIILLQKYINLTIINENLSNIFFTLLETVLVFVMYLFYKFGKESNSIYKKNTNLTLGIGGDSGVGKTSLLNDLEKLLGSRLLTLEGDGEHKWERGDKNWEKFTHLDPKANYIHKQAEAIYDLKNNKTIYRSDYDHNNGKFTKPIEIKPNDFIAISGLHPFYLPMLRKNIDLKIYLDTSEKLRRHWKILRDTQKRGYSQEKIIKQIEARVDDTIKHIYPQKTFADIIICYFEINDFILGDKDVSVEIGLKITFDANIHIEEILEFINIQYDWDYNDDLKTQYIKLYEIPDLNYEFLSRKYISNISEIVETKHIWSDGFNSFVQLILLKMISEKLKDTNES